MTVFTAALGSRCGNSILALLLLSFFLLLFFRCLFSAVGDCMHTSTHDVALLRIQNAGPKCAARGSLEIHDAKITQKIAICMPSHNFEWLFLLLCFAGKCVAQSVKNSIPWREGALLLLPPPHKWRPCRQIRSILRITQKRKPLINYPIFQS